MVAQSRCVVPGSTDKTARNHPRARHSPGTAKILQRTQHGLAGPAVHTGCCWPSGALPPRGGGVLCVQPAPGLPALHGLRAISFQLFGDSKIVIGSTLGLASGRGHLEPWCSTTRDLLQILQQTLREVRPFHEGRELIQWRLRALNKRADALAQEAMNLCQAGSQARISYWRPDTTISPSSTLIGAFDGGSSGQHAGCGAWLAIADAPCCDCSGRCCTLFESAVPLPGRSNNQAEFAGLRLLLSAVCAMVRAFEY